MPATRLLFHIGHHKTGSTSVQEAFATGKISLPGRRLLYPTVMNHNYLRPHFDAFAATGRAPTGRPAQPGLARIAERLAELRPDYLILSAEEFEGAQPSDVRKVLDHFLMPHLGAYRIICYLRPHAGRTLSNFAEDIKVGIFDGTLEQMHRRQQRSGKLVYHKRLAPWQQQFGPALRLRVMERRHLVNGSVVEDFIHAGFDEDAPRVRIAPLSASNESLTVEELVLLRLIHRRIGHRGRRLSHVMGWEIARLLGAQAPAGTATRPALHKSLAEMIRRDYREDATIMDRQFADLGGVFARALDQAVETAQPQPQSWQPEDYYSADALRAIDMLLRLIDAMLDKDSADWPQFLNQRRVDALHDKGSSETGGRAQSGSDLPVTCPKSALKSGADGRRKNGLENPAKKALGSGQRPGPSLTQRAARLLPGLAARLPDHLKERLVARLDGRQRPRPQVGAVPRAEVAPPTTGMDLVHRVLAADTTDMARLDALSRRLNNLFLGPGGRQITMTTDQVRDLLPSVGAMPDHGARDVLNEFLVQLFFHRHGAALSAGHAGIDDLLGAKDEIGRTLRHLRDEPGIAWPLLTGGIHYLRHDHVAAYDDFDRARQMLLAGRPVRHHNRGLLSLRPIPVLRAWAGLEEGTAARRPDLPAIEFVSDRDFDNNLPVAMVGLDGGYFRRYGPRLIDSAAGRCNLHFHVINPGGTALPPGPGLRYSVENRSDATPAYYAVSRFLRLPAVLNRYQRPVMVMDADACFSAAPDALFARLAQQDLVMTAAPGFGGGRGYLNAVPWRRVLAQILLAAPTEGAEQALAVLGALYAGLTGRDDGAHDDGAPHWWVDQALLSMTADLLRDDAGVRIAQGWLHRDSGVKQSKLG